MHEFHATTPAASRLRPGASLQQWRGLGTRMSEKINRLEGFLHGVSERQQELQLALSNVHESLKDISSIVTDDAEGINPVDSENGDVVIDGSFMFPNSLVGSGTNTCAQSVVSEDSEEVIPQPAGSIVRLHNGQIFQPSQPAQALDSSPLKFPCGMNPAVSSEPLGMPNKQEQREFLSEIMVSALRPLLYDVAKRMEDSLGFIVQEKIVPRLDALVPHVEHAVKLHLEPFVSNDWPELERSRQDVLEADRARLSELNNLLQVAREHKVLSEEKARESAPSDVKAGGEQGESTSSDVKAGGGQEAQDRERQQVYNSLQVNVSHEAASQWTSSESRRSRQIDDSVFNYMYERGESTVTLKSHKYHGIVKRGLRKAASFVSQEEPKRSGPLASVLYSKNFERVVSFVIILNVWFIGYCAEFALSNTERQSNDFIKITELLFQAFYIGELALKLWVRGIYLFFKEDWRWNNVDFVLVLLSIYDIIMTYSPAPDDLGGPAASGADNGFNVTFLRMLRLLRVSKIFRAFRVMRFFRELRVMLSCIVSSLGTLFWCSAMLGIFYYIFAIIFMHAVADYLADARDERMRDRLLEQWGTVFQSMVRLFEASTGGRDWSEIGDDIEAMGIMYFMIFLFYIAFILIAVLNILTGIFVDTAIRVSERDASGVEETLDRQRELVILIEKLFYHMRDGEPWSSLDDINPDYDDDLSQEAFEASIAASKIRARFESIGIEIREPHLFYMLLASRNSSGVVTLKSFINGCLELRGHAERISIQALRITVSHVAKDVKEIRHALTSGSRGHEREAASET